MQAWATARPWRYSPGRGRSLGAGRTSRADDHREGISHTRALQDMTAAHGRLQRQNSAAPGPLHTPRVVTRPNCHTGPSRETSAGTRSWAWLCTIYSHSPGEGQLQTHKGPCRSQTERQTRARTHVHQRCSTHTDTHMHTETRTHTWTNAHTSEPVCKAPASLPFECSPTAGAFPFGAKPLNHVIFTCITNLPIYS